VSRCRTCGADIQWALTTNGKRMPVDAEPTPEGNIRLRKIDGEVFADVVAPLSSDKLRLSHFATCPGAAKHRKVA
jgi:hypothetical protein